MSRIDRIEQINAVLPQTQCQRCDYAGCKPYAEAMLQGEKISRCAPGGVAVLEQLAELLEQDPSPYYAEVAAQYTEPAVAYIREDDCIGCTKCMQVCPTDAIVGSSKMIHTVIMRDCTGCGLCVPACPVDCIEMNHDTAMRAATPEEQGLTRLHFKEQYEKKQKRLEDTQHKKKERDAHARFKDMQDSIQKTNKEKMLAEIQQAVVRAKEKKKYL